MEVLHSYVVMAGLGPDPGILTGGGSLSTCSRETAQALGSFIAFWFFVCFCWGKIYEICGIVQHPFDNNSQSTGRTLRDLWSFKVLICRWWWTYPAGMRPWKLLCSGLLNLKSVIPVFIELSKLESMKLFKLNREFDAKLLTVLQMHTVHEMIECSFLTVPFIHACEERSLGKCSGGSRRRWISRALSSTFSASCWEFEDEIHLPGDTTTGTGTAVSVTWRVWYYFDTSSAAHGGDGSFKNWKPIGDVGCC